jgi:phage-related protein
MIEIFYNNLALHSGPYNVTDYDGYGMPEVEIKSIDLARNDGGVQTNTRLGSRTLTVSGQIKTLTKANLITAIQQLKAYMYQTKGQLKVTDEDGVTRTFEATPQRVSVTRQRGGATQAAYSVQFFAPKPYSTSGIVTLLNSTITASPVNLGISVLGSYPASPIITLTINSITAGVQTITISNDAIDRNIKITNTFVAGDVIVIDTATKNVYLNTLKVNYKGAFPKWLVGGGSIAYTDTASARNVGIVVTAEVREL